MVFKSYHNPVGLDYDIDDDPGETTSIGSTMSIKEQKKTEENWINKRQNKNTTRIATITCSNKTDKHTEEGEWKISTKGRRKPKTDKNSYHQKETSTNNRKSEEENITNNGELEKEIKTHTKTRRNTNNDNKKKNEIDSADNQEDKKKRRRIIEEQKRCEADRQETTTRRDEDKKKIGDKNKTAKYDEEASSRLRNTLRIQKTLQEKQNHTNIATARTSEISKNNEEKERRKKKNDQEEGIKVISNSKEITNEGDNNNMDTNTREEGEIEDNTNEHNSNKDEEDKNNKNNNTSNNEKNNEKGDPDGRKQNNGKSVSIMDLAEMDTFTFTIGWNPKDYRGRDGKAVLRSLLRAILHKSPGTIFHPTNRNTAPTPRDIHSVNSDFPNTPEEFDDFFDQTTNRNRSNYRIYMKATMSHNEKELQQRMFNYLRHNKIYLNSPFIDDTTLEMVGFIENGHSRLIYRPNIEIKIKKGIEEVINGKTLSPTQKAQLRNLSNPIRVVCYSGTFQAGSNANPVICDGLLLKSAKSQAKLVMELLAMLPENIIGDQYNIIPKSLNALLGYETYGKIVADTINYTVNLTPITIINCHPSVFEDQYDNVKSSGSKTISVRKFIKNCGVISIENTSETEKNGKYILVVPKNKAETARNAIGRMFQEFQQQSGRPTAMACLEAYQMYPLVNDNVTISGHAEVMATKYRNKYKNKTTAKHSPYTPYDFHGRTSANSPGIEQTTTAHVPTSILNSQRHTTSTRTPTHTTIQNNQQNNPRRKQQQQQTTATRLFPTTTHSPATQHADALTIGTQMSGLSPDDSAKTMMTNMSKMVESIGTVVTKLADQNAQTNDTMKHTNDTMKEMMVQQATQMNNLMAIICRNEERRYEGDALRIPQTINPTSTPADSTMTNSQQSMTQNQSPQKRLRTEQKEDEDGTATTATTTTPTEQEPIAEREELPDERMEDENYATESQIEEDLNERKDNDETMEEWEETERTTEQATHNNTRRNEGQITTPIAAGNFDHQFEKRNKDKAHTNPVPDRHPGGSQQ